MIRPILDSKLLASKTVTVVEASFQNGSEAVYQLSVLKHEKQEVQVEKLAQALTWEALVEELDKKHPVVLVVTGKGVLFKAIETVDQAPKWLLNRVLPNANPEEFFVQTYETGKVNYAAIVRQNVVQELLENLRSAGPFVVDIHVGPFALATAGALLKRTNEFTVGNYNLLFEGEQLAQLKKNADFEAKTFAFGEDQVPAENMVSFLAGVSFFHPLLAKSQIDLPVLQQYQEEQKQRAFLQKAGLGALVFFFLVLLANYFYFDHYNKLYDNLFDNSNISESQVFQLQELERDLKQKEDLLQSNGLTATSRFSWYADQLAQSIPTAIRLTAMDAFPLTNQMKPDKRLSFDRGVIKISGVTTKNADLNNWVALLRNLEWVTDLTLGDIHILEGKGGTSFELKLTLG